MNATVPVSEATTANSSLTNGIVRVAPAASDRPAGVPLAATVAAVPRNTGVSPEFWTITPGRSTAAKISVGVVPTVTVPVPELIHHSFCPVLLVRFGIQKEPDKSV